MCHDVNTQTSAGTLGSSPATLLHNPSHAHVYLQAILLYKGQRYDEAIQLLSPLVRRADMLDAGTALHACLLLLDLHLQQRRGREAADALDALERVCAGILLGAGVGDEAAVSTTPAQNVWQMARHAATANVIGGDSLALPLLSDWSCPAAAQAQQLLLSQGRCCQSPPAPPGLLLPPLLRLYRARLALLLRRTDAVVEALHDSGPEPLPPCSPPSQPASGTGSWESRPCEEEHAARGSSSSGMGAASRLAEAQLALLRGGPGRATEILLNQAVSVSHSSSGHGSGGGCSRLAAGFPLLLFSDAGVGVGGDVGLQPLLLNNLGVVHHCQARHQVAAVFFSRAMEAAASQERAAAAAAAAAATPSSPSAAFAGDPVRPAHTTGSGAAAGVTSSSPFQ